ncbi:hypothetical protein [Corynebacterium glyciniphilum]|uniref:hypothetical protein n=1 Tax=Corynebacterium glyciniphilum TaxID=1404244 RepID=UPI0011AB53BB|nr:hypothetical protein [Corynebacterium glyciniphilum]
MSTSTPTKTTPVSPAGRRAKELASRLGQLRRWHPDTDHFAVEQDVVAARLDVALDQIMSDYNVAALRPEQVAYFVDRLLGRVVSS